MQMRLVIVIKGGKTVRQEKHYLQQNMKARQLGTVPRTSTPLFVEVITSICKKQHKVIHVGLGLD